MVDMLAATNETYAACGVPVGDESDTLINLSAAIGSIALLFVILRLVDRSISAKTRLGYDDLLIGCAGVRFGPTT